MTPTINATHRLAFHAAALATLGTCPIWDKALTDYIARAALATADEAFGRTWEKSQEIDWKVAGYAVKHGRLWRDLAMMATPASEIMASEDELDRHRSEKFVDPMEHAARELLATPSPSLAAALFKIELIDMHELHNDIRFPAHCMSILQDDLGRITGR